MEDDLRPKPQIRVSERKVEYDTLVEEWEELLANDSVPQYVWRRRERGRVSEERLDKET